jgi:prolyl oligopeptidase
VLAGLSFPDPFRPLENGLDPAVAAWQKAQAELVDAYVAGLPGVEDLRAQVARCLVDRVGSVPRFAGGRWFRNDDHVVVAREPMSPGTVVFDPGDHLDEHDRAPVISWLSPSLDGRLLALGLCYDGSESNTIRVVDVESCELLADRPPQLLMDNWLGGAQWLPDSSGFFYVALDGPREAFELRVFRHEIGKPVRPGPEAVPLTAGPGDEYVGVFVSRGGRWVVVSQNNRRTRPVAVLDLADTSGRWRPFITESASTVAGHAVGDELVAVTDHDAPRGRLVAIPMTSAASSDPASWRVLVPESDAVLLSVTPVGDLLYVSDLVDTYSRVRIVDLDGAEVGRVPLPGRGAVAEAPFSLMRLPPRGHPDEYVFAFSSLTESWGIYRHRPGEDTVETLEEPAVRIDAVVEDLWATSADGTRVPYHRVRRRDLSATAPQPTLVYGYGGYRAALMPRFPRSMAAVVEAGGVFVHAHLRGGGELGLDWWEGGRMGNKQNSYDDLYAVAEDLIASGRTAPDRLAVTGASNGGLMAGVAVTQRPELWCAVVPRVPLLDLLGACREPYGRAAVGEELGDPEDPDDVARLAGFSPYQLVANGAAYPAVYVDAGATDPRCSPWHGRKFAARLQEASSSGRPIFLRVWENVGHGWATARDAEIDQETAWLAFVIDQLGMTGRTPNGCGRCS